MKTMKELMFNGYLKFFMEDILELAKNQPTENKYRIFIVCNGLKSGDVVDMLVSLESGIPYNDIIESDSHGGRSSLKHDGLEKYMNAVHRLTDEYSIDISENMPNKIEWDEISDNAYVVFVIKVPKYLEEELNTKFSKKL